ncbi:MAG: DNA translocase FtsK 4TM domain-containing protein [Nitrospirae bacterium]|nr:DNA translocase FtsK 4TM domain-containing protein [Nitrospirota bacterium]
MDKVGRIKEEIAGILYLLVGIIILVSLFSHSTWDPSAFTHKPAAHGGINNTLGLFGSYLSDILLQLMGLSAYLFPAVLMIYGIKKVLGRADGRKGYVFAGIFVLLIIASASLFSLALGKQAEGNPSGGLIGFYVTNASTGLLSVIGSYLLFITLLIVTLMYLIPFSLIDLLRAVKDKTVKGAGSIPVIKPSFKMEKPKEKKQPTIKEEPLPEIPEKQGHLPLKYPEKKLKPTDRVSGKYELPTLELLNDPPPSKSKPSKEELLEISELLEKKLLDFSVEGRVTYVSPGPIVTMFEFQPAPGIKINKVVSLTDDLAMAFKANSLRISPIPGKSTLGIEVPNKDSEDVFLQDILASDTFRKAHSKLTMVLGKDIFGNPVVADLAKMPHLLVAGATGSGKSVGINAMILSLLYRATPADVKMLMIDPKMLELSAYQDIPHLLMPVVTNSKEASAALRKVVFEMERRYRLLAESGSRNIEAYNAKLKGGALPQSISATEKGDVRREPLPYIIVLIDELSDLMLVSAHEVEDSIARLAQMARASGIHLILATQRPSVDVITGVIKANFPSRIAFHVSSKLDSRIILDTYGADQLLGKGDMLYMSPGKKVARVHGAYVSEEEVRNVVNFIKAQGNPDYTVFKELTAEPEKESNLLEEQDELYKEAKDLVLSTGQASISYIQRRMKIGYNRAARIMEMMEEEGIVGPAGEAGKSREVFGRDS